MTVREAAAFVDSVKPNAFTDENKLSWLAALEGRLLAEVFLMAPVEVEQLRLTYPSGMDIPLAVRPPHDELYTLWLAAKIDEANGEYNKYQNSMQAFNSLYSGFLRWFAGRYDPAEGYLPESPRTIRPVRRKETKRL